MAPYKVLNEVIDSLDVRISRHARPSSWLYRQTGVWRLYIEQWEPTDYPLYCELEGIGTFRLKVGGRPPYEFVLINPQICDVRIWNPAKWDSEASCQTGQLFISFRSAFLQYYGLPGARAVIQALVDLLCSPAPMNDHGPEFDRIARIDLAVDMQEPRDMAWADLDAFVCRSRVLDTWTSVSPVELRQLLDKTMLTDNIPPSLRPSEFPHIDRMTQAAAACIQEFTQSALQDLETYGEADLCRVISKNRKPQTIYFGRFGSQLYARRYNKLGSLAIQNKLYMLEIWLENGWDAESSVIRTEFSLSGDFLKDFKRCDGSDFIELDARDLNQLEINLLWIWAYLTKSWLRYTEPQGKNVNRWPINECWRNIQSAFNSLGVPIGVRDSSRKIPREYIHLIKQARGCNITAVALRAAANPGARPTDLIGDMFAQMTNQMLVPEFMDEVEERMYEMGLDAYTDVCLTTLFRRERVREGWGS